MKDSQQEIKSTVTVNTSDIAAKAHEDKEQGKDLEKLAKKRGSKFLVMNYYFQSVSLHSFAVISNFILQIRWKFVMYK
jgi:hypothetical protein